MDVFADCVTHLQRVKLPATWSTPKLDRRRPFPARALRLMHNSYAGTSSMFVGPFAMRQRHSG